MILQAFRRVVAVNPLPSKSVKEELATKLGLTFSQVTSSVVVLVPCAQQSEKLGIMFLPEGCISSTCTCDPLISTYIHLITQKIVVLQLL